MNSLLFKMTETRKHTLHRSVCLFISCVLLKLKHFSHNDGIFVLVVVSFLIYLHANGF